MKKPNYPLFFVHIPKTAGTSFRLAAKDFFGDESTFYDYGEKYIETHPKIVELEYQKKDRFAAGQYISKHAKFLSGHVSYLKYAPFINAASVITFVRSPDQHIRSHFEHYVRLHGYKESFETFILESRFINLQSRLLTSIGIDSLGFVGLAEEYDTSITLINSLYQIDFQRLQANKNQKKEAASYVLTDKELALIQEHNQADYSLYKQACIRFQRQKQAVEESVPFIRFGLLPLPLQRAQQVIRGWATCYESNKAQNITVFINGHKAETIIANEYIGIANERNMNRTGFIGFTYHFPKDIKPNDKIEFYSAINNALLHTTYFKSTR